MADEIVLNDRALAGETLYANLHQGLDVYSIAAAAYAALDPDDPEDRAIALDDPAGTGQFRADLPAGLTMDESHEVIIYKQLDPAGPLDSDPEVGRGPVGTDPSSGGIGNPEIEDGITLTDGMAVILAGVAGLVGGAGIRGGPVVIRKAGGDADSAARIVATTDAFGNRTSVQLQLPSQDP